MTWLTNTLLLIIDHVSNYGWMLITLGTQSKDGYVVLEQNKRGGMDWAPLYHLLKYGYYEAKVHSVFCWCLWC
jgi:hypothetical protein